jgi:hypothetical protein
MLKRLFLSIIILSTLASEGGVPYSADLIDYYLVNLAHLDIIQDSRSAVPVFDAQKLTETQKKGIPAAIFKLISQKSISTFNLKQTNKHNFFEFILIMTSAVALFILVGLFISLNTQGISILKRTLLSLTDSSPPVYC